MVKVLGFAMSLGHCLLICQIGPKEDGGTGGGSTTLRVLLTSLLRSLSRYLTGTLYDICLLLGQNTVPSTNFLIFSNSYLLRR